MRPQEVVADAARKRQQLAEHLEARINSEALAALWETNAARLLEVKLTLDVEAWEKVTAWGPLDIEAVREQGKALRSRELLEYFRGAKDAAEFHRAEATRLAGLLEAAADKGRIPRV